MDVVVELHLLSAEEGGRTSATPSDKLRCIFEYEGENFDCVLLLSGVGSLSPGDHAEVPVAFLFPELIKPRLQVGSEFRLRDYRTIAEGRVTRVIEAPCSCE